MKKKKHPKKKKTLIGVLQKSFLIFAIIFFLLAISGISDGIISVFVFCLLCGFVCLYVYRLLKKHAAVQAGLHEMQIDHKKSAAAIGDFKENINNFNMVEITFPDGHIERRHILETIDADEGCLISDGGYTYHTDVGCFCNWSEQYKERFTGWQLISIEDAKRRGLRKCKFCIENDSE